METKFFSINWTDYLEAIRTCLLKTESKISKPDFIFAPVRGGLIPAVIMSHWLKIKMYAMEPDELDKTIHPYSFEEIKKRKPTVLLLDDISDSGHTFKKCVTYLEKLGYKVLTCSVVIKLETSFTPDLFAIVVSKNRWVMFPYENIDNEKGSIKEREEDGE